MPVSKNSQLTRVQVILNGSMLKNLDNYLAKFKPNMTRSEYLRLLIEKDYNTNISERILESNSKKINITE